MIRMFFPKIREKVNSLNTPEKNREILANYLNKNIVLWMFWSLFFMVYANCRELSMFKGFGEFDVGIATFFEYIFLFQSFLAIGIAKILILTEDQANALCRAIRGDKYKD